MTLEDRLNRVAELKRIREEATAEILNLMNLDGGELSGTQTGTKARRGRPPKSTLSLEDTPFLQQTTNGEHQATNGEAHETYEDASLA